MPRDRRNLPPELRDALRAAGRTPRRPGRWRRHLSMLLPGALVPSLLFVVWYVAWHRGDMASPVVIQGPASVPPPPPQATAPATRPAAPAGMPRVIYGGDDGASRRDSGTITVRAVVVDGDTIAANGERLRLNGIDAPEMAQQCESEGRAYACGEQARAAMARIMGSGPLTCVVIGVDRYDRRVVRCLTEDGQDIAAALVAAGWAVAYRQFSMDYVPQEDEARTRGRGISAGRFEYPWDWRRRQGY